MGFCDVYTVKRDLWDAMFEDGLGNVALESLSKLCNKITSGWQLQEICVCSAEMPKLLVLLHVTVHKRDGPVPISDDAHSQAWNRTHAMLNNTH